MRFTTICPPFGGQEASSSKNVSSSGPPVFCRSMPKRHDTNLASVPLDTAYSCLLSKARHDRSQLLWVPRHPTLPPSQTVTSCICISVRQNVQKMSVTCQVILVFLAFVDWALSCMCSASCLNDCEKGKEPWCPETNKLIIQIKMNATGINAVTEWCLQASGESILTHLGSFACAPSEEGEELLRCLEKSVSIPPGLDVRRHQSSVSVAPAAARWEGRAMRSWRWRCLPWRNDPSNSQLWWADGQEKWRWSSVWMAAMKKSAERMTYWQFKKDFDLLHQQFDTL